MGTGTTAELLLVVGDNPARIRSEDAFAKLCGACPIPASSGKIVDQCYPSSPQHPPHKGLNKNEERHLRKGADLRRS